MAWLTSLWLPIVLSAVLVFVASSIIWMALPIHKKDYKKLGDKEAAVMDLVRSGPIGAGLYMFPMCDQKTMKTDPAMAAKVKAGPWGTILVMPRCWNMGQMLGLWMVNLLIVSGLIGYLAWYAMPGAHTFASVFRVVATAAFLAYGGNALTDSIWKGRPWSMLCGALFDAVVYAAVTGAAFAWLWPKAAGMM